MTEIGYDSRTAWYDPANVSISKRERYETLDQHNRDNFWKYREDVDVAKDYDRQLKLKSTLGIASQLGLSDLQKQIAVDRLFEIDGRRFGERTETVAFCLCAIVVNEEAEKRDDGEKAYHPARNDANNDRRFVRVQNQLVESFGPITKSRLHSIYAKLQQGEPPRRDDDETHDFVRANSVVQRRPSFTPEGTLPQPTGEA
ncbi:hypothetical protein PN409_05330 [Halorubrum ezzemoulense]|nr:hypothetical protein [Halorubrum ezzemoulense]